MCDFRIKRKYCLVIIFSVTCVIISVRLVGCGFDLILIGKCLCYVVCTLHF